MIGLKIIMDGDGAFPDLKDREVIEPVGTPAIAMLKGGLKSGNPSVAIRLDLDGKRTVFFQTSLTLLENAVRAFKTASELRQAQDNENVSAFCLATYQCKACGYLERIWNSRKGVTPFMVPCAKCKEPAAHVEWNKDTRDENYKPQPGERIFITFSKRAWEAYLRTQKLDFDPDTEPDRFNAFVDECYEDGIHPNLLTVAKCATCKFTDDNWECSAGEIAAKDGSCHVYEEGVTDGP